MNSVYEKIKYLVEYLNEHTKAYDEGNPKITDLEWDKNYFELVKLEKESGIILPNSPTQVVSYKVVNALEKVEHNHKMLSLEKTKDIEVIKGFGKGKDILAMCKMDGLTCSLTYENGRLVSAETRGNGLVGENILHNAKVLSSIPKVIQYKEKLVVDGEIICTFDNFKPFASEYKNPRNFAAGSIRLLDSRECAKRNLSFVAWDILQGYSLIPQLSDKLCMLIKDGFTIVPYMKGDIEDCIEGLREVANTIGFPIDGIVFKFDDVKYGQSLGETSHHFKNAMAYKFYDEVYETRLCDIEWSMGRTGTLTPVAIFDPVDIDGAEVSRASMHNISVMTELLGSRPHPNQKIRVYKSNMIIPQIYDADKDIPGTLYYMENQDFEIPSICPICGGRTEQSTYIDSTVLKCLNPDCSGQLINKIDHFCGKKGLDIKGISKATLEKLIEWNWVQSCEDLFNLTEFQSDWIKKPGFGVKSVEKILNAIETSSKCDLHQFIAALGIPLIGTTASKELEKHFKTWEDFMSAIKKEYHFYELPNFGIEMHSAIINFDYTEAHYIATHYINFNSITEIDNNSNQLNGQIFVITGKLKNFKNRDELKSLIERNGGKVTGSVSKNTNYLINNDINSDSSKNKTAKSLSIPILSEEDFIQTFGDLI